MKYPPFYGGIFIWLVSAHFARAAPLFEKFSAQFARGAPCFEKFFASCETGAFDKFNKM